MKEKIKRLLFEYTRNSRLTTKEMGKGINSSQQSVSYLLGSLKNKKLIERPVTIVDPIKLGYISVLVGFNFLIQQQANIKEIINELKEVEAIVSIEEGKEGIDLLVEYLSPNLSSFNKTHSEIIYKYYLKLKTAFIFPIIVSHNYYKNYLIRKFDATDNILHGDRLLIDITDKESKVLHELVKNPDKKLIDIAESTKIPIKTAVKIKKSLEKNKIIKGYTAILNFSKLGIKREIIFLRFSGEGIGEIDKFAEYTKYNKNIIRFFKIIGEYQIGIIIESLKEVEMIKDIRANFLIENYKIIKSEKIHKKTYLPV